MLAGTEKYDDEPITAAVRDAIASLIDTPTLTETMSNFGEHPTVWDYNRTRMGRVFGPGFAETNPLAAAWLGRDRAAARHIRDFAHPGELVSAARTRLKSLGLDMRLYKSVNRLSAEFIARLLSISTESQQRMILALEQSARGAAQNAPMPASRALSSVIQHRASHGLDTNSPNQLLAARLLLAASSRLAAENPDEDQTDMMSEHYSILDYIENADRTGETIRSTTFGGLSKHSRRWHTQRNLTEFHGAFGAVLRQFNGHYRAWNSLIEETRAEPYRIVPLTSELQLHRQTLTMSNCVAEYGKRCADGSSRIFAIYRDGVNIGTMELRKYQNTWTAAQTSGHRNHPLDEDAGRAAEHVAELYQQAWDRAPEDKRQTLALVAAKPEDMPGTAA